MKKISVLALSLFLTLGSFAQTYNDWSKWSITLEGGINRFDGDITQHYGGAIIPTSLSKFTLGASLEYTVTPAWSLGLDYYHLPLAAEHYANNQFIYGFNTKMNNVSLFTSVNAVKLFLPHTQTRWGLWGGIGYGLATYKVNYETTRDGQYINTKWGKFLDENYSKDDGFTQFVPVHLLAEYNLTKSIAAGVMIQYRGFFIDNIDGRFRPNANDALEFATLQLRWKFGAHNKDHTRNINSATYNGDVSLADLYRLQDKVNGIIVPVIDPTDKLNDLDGRLKKLEGYLDIDGPDDDGDGVPNSRDLEPDTPRGNQVDFWGRTINSPSQIDESALVYFDFDKTNLDAEAHKAIQLAASKLQADPSLIVEVRGFTDNMGSNAYNAGLSQRRADVVKQELVKKYGIDANRIVANGKGKYNPNDKVVPYRLYRTTAFFYNK